MILITPIGFEEEWYFFMFTNNYIRIIKMYTAKRKNEWFKYLKPFNNLIQIQTKLD